MSIKNERLISRAKKLIKKGENEQAKEIYLNILKSFPNNQEAKKGINLLAKEKDNHVIKVGLKSGNDFASKWGQGLKGKSGVPQGMKLISELWNKCYDNIPQGKEILQSRLDDKYFQALEAKGANSEYKYIHYLENPLTGLV